MAVVAWWTPYAQYLRFGILIIFVVIFPFVLFLNDSARISSIATIRSDNTNKSMISDSDVINHSVTFTPTLSPSDTKSHSRLKKKKLDRNRCILSSKSNIAVSPKHRVKRPICQLLFPSRIHLIAHHKTGTVLSRNILREIDNFCHSEWDSSMQMSFVRFLGEDHFNNHHSNVSVHFHFVRDPVLTIISGFHYHQSCDELFATHPITARNIEIVFNFFGKSTNLQTVRSLYHDLVYGFRDDLDRGIIEEIRYIDRTTKQQKSLIRDFWGQRKGRMGIRYMFLFYMQYLAFSVDLNGFGDFYGFHLDFDDLEINRKFNIFRNLSTLSNDTSHDMTNYNQFMQQFGTEDMIGFGLYFSMIRYLFVVFPEIYSVHFDVLSAAERQANVYKMEDWMSDFDGTIRRFMNALNLMPTDENKKILESNDCGTVHIGFERRMLGKALNHLDSTKENKYAFRMSHHSKMMMHVHSGRNNTKYIHELLTFDEQICCLLKHVTLLIEYEWMYTEYC